MTRVALVTGSTSGIGIRVAERLVDDGLRVVVTGRSAERGAEVADRLGDAATFVQADLTADGAADRLVSEAVAWGGSLDVLVSNAAIDHTGQLETVPRAEIEQTFAANAIAPIVLAQAAARQMIAQRGSGGAAGGAIIHVSSRLASIGVPSMGVYSASKGAINAFVKASAIEWAPHGIRVNAVAPGMTRTAMFDEWVAGHDDPSAVESGVASQIPLGRIAEPDDVAHAISYLASDGAAYVTGAIIPLDGGYTAK